MFYCDTCRVERDLPVTVFESLGKCELCGTPGACYDLPASAMPVEPRAVRSTDDPKDLVGEECTAYGSKGRITGCLLREDGIEYLEVEIGGTVRSISALQWVVV